MRNRRSPCLCLPEINQQDASIRAEPDYTRWSNDNRSPSVLLLAVQECGMHSDDDLTTLWRSNKNPHFFLIRAEATLDYALQPIVDVHSGGVYGFEGLLRNVDALEFVHPGEVFDFAHEIGCLPRLERVLWRKLIGRFASLENRYAARLFANVDLRAIAADPNLMKETIAVLTQYGLTPADICLELPETYNTTSSRMLADFVDETREAGFSLALDDFGQGYSQFRSLYEYAIDLLKIDRFFVSSMQSDARKRLFVSSLVDLAHVLGMRVVAEGVETEAELNICRDIGCGLIKGYYIARPTTDYSLLSTSYKHLIPNKTHQDAARTDNDLLAQAIIELPSVSKHSNMSDVLKVFASHPHISVVPVVNDRGEPRGIVREVDLKNMLYQPFGRDLLCNPTVQNGLRRFICSNPIADINSRLDQLIDIDGDTEHEGIIITRNGKYSGYLTLGAMLRISNEIRLREAADQNPLTKLPGNSTVSAYVADVAQFASEERQFCYLDFDNFKPFNDTYGFRLGDRAIILFADLIRRKLGFGPIKWVCKSFEI